VSTQQTDTGERTAELGSLRRCLERALVALGVPIDHAKQIADVLLDAELRGYDDHGVFFLCELAG
jgi:LDH2 family malate/lactate/ureidoglycolate dehydrogenase